MKENYNGILEKYRPVFRSYQNITILKIRLRKILIARHLFTFALLFSTIIAHSQVSENFDKATLSSGSLNCWESTYDSQTFGSARVAAPTTQPLGMDSRLSLETTSPITGSASLKVTESLVVPINKSAISTETLTSTAYGNDGDNVSFKVRINSADITAYQALSVNIVCGNYYYSLPITTADIGNTITVSQTISGSGGGGIIKIELLYINDAFLNAVTTYSYSVDIDDFTTTANINPDNNCANLPPVTLSGQVWDDGNGDAVIGGVEATSPNDVTDDPAEKLTVYITDETGLIVGKADVLADGTYSIPGINPSATYTVTLSNDNTLEVGTSPAIPTVLPTNWVNTGTNFPGTGANPNDGALGTVTVGTTDLADVNFGIEKKPVVTDQLADTTPNPSGNALAPVNFTLPSSGEGYAGSDLEDGTYPPLLDGETVSLTPGNNGDLYYDFDGPGENAPVQITAATTITNFDPANVYVDPAGINATSITITFTYAAVDNSGVWSDPATVTVPFDINLPVTLVKFSTEKLPSESGVSPKALVSWTTSQEINSDRFEIQHSINGKSWNVIGTLAAKTESKTLAAYSYIHDAPVNGENLYRLKMIDRDGTFAFSRISSLNLDIALNLSLYPNPAVNLIKIKMDGIADWNEIANVKLYSPNGQIVHASQQLVSSEIDVTHIPSGTYVVTITHKNGTIHKEKILIVK